VVENVTPCQLQGGCSNCTATAISAGACPPGVYLLKYGPNSVHCWCPSTHYEVGNNPSSKRHKQSNTVFYCVHLHVALRAKACFTCRAQQLGTETPLSGAVC
jgi:hypothetical protein